MTAPSLPRLVAPEDFVARLRDDNLRIVDLSQPRVYMQAHVPGAVHVDFRLTQAGTLPAPGALPSAAAISEMLSMIGVTPDMHVVAYDDEGGGWAGRFLWLLTMVGHTKWSYLDGGIHAWLAAGLPIEQDVTEVEPSTYQARISGDASVDKQYLRLHLGDPDLVIWDARSRDEFLGVRALAARGGHIPGAVNLDWIECMDRTRSLRLKDLGELRATLAGLGITADREIVTHCQTNHRSGLTWLVGTLLGFPRMRAYPGSWSEWGNDPSLPVESPLQ
ncbi:MAG: sulfurtransferase [Gammaproteobacteria bacterium]